MRNAPCRLRLIPAAVAGGTLTGAVLAAPAFAHVEVSADKPQAGATNVTVTFSGEAESTTAGIRSERVYLPAGITVADVKLAKAPAGWRYAKTADGYTVSGPALRTGTDAVHSVTIARLPADASELVFKVVETYGDGEVSRWIALREPGQGEPDNPAPVLKLKAAAATPKPGSSAPTASPTPAATSAAATSVAPAPVTITTTAAADAADPAGRSHTGRWIVAAVVVGLVAVAGVVLARRRRPSAQP